MWPFYVAQWPVNRAPVAVLLRLLHQALFPEIFKLMHNYSYQIDGLDRYGKTLVDIFHGLFAELSLDAKKSSFGLQFSVMESVPLYLLGGGNCYYWYQKWPKASYVARLSQCGVPKPKHQRLYHLPDIENLDKAMHHRFRVASGLLRVETMLRATGYPCHFQLEEYPTTKVNLHELLETRMTEKYGK